jgi:hypothetical protein
MMGLMVQKKVPRRNQELLRLFDRYAANLTAIGAQFEHTFICPCCLREFRRESALELLSIEHAVPESVGGRLRTLTCRSCNNTQGSQLDAQLSKRCDAENALDGKSSKPLNGWLLAADGKIRVSWHCTSQDAPTVELREISHCSPPKEREKLLTAFQRGGKVSLKFESTGLYDARLSRIAMLRAAYLYLFSLLGYGYILHSCLGPVRDQIRDPTARGISEHAVIDLKPQWPAIRAFFLHTPAELRSFLVSIELKRDGSVRKFGVLLPGLDSDSLTLYKRCAEWRGEPLEFEAAQLKDPQIIKRAERAAWPAAMWRELCALASH